jgi:RsiW-degrading membrane proteinase PrsW (M82 family)
MMRRSTRFIAVVTACILLVGAALGIVASRRAASISIEKAPDEETQASTALVFGEGRGPEEVFWHLLQTEPPTLDRILQLLDAHDIARGARVKRPIFSDDRDDDDGEHDPDDLAVPIRPVQNTTIPFLSESQIDAFLARPDLPFDMAQLGRYWREVLDGGASADLKAWILAAADRDDPLPDANRLLGDEARTRNAEDEAAARYMREGRFVPDHRHYILRALILYEDLKDWSAVADAMSDPNVAAFAGPALKAQVAVERNDWPRVVKWTLIQSYQPPPIAPLVLTLMAALAWAVFCAQLGKARERPFFRPLVYLAAFGLGIGSICVTDFAILVEESKLHLVESGEPVRDALYFVFGVGFREELSKLLLFAPLLPVLRRYGTKLDVILCGAFVGLGFAGVENISYLDAGNVSTGLGRFLSANFLHMAMTAILASAVDDFVTKGDDHAPELSRTVLMVIVLHGLYDFFITHPKIGGGYLSMMCFFILANQFLVTVESARGRSQKNDRLFATFVIGIAVVLASSFVWASILVGPGKAALALTGGLLGDAILIYVFARRFREI